MAFHESFWVVAGTAAPVIALAAIVALGDAARMSGEDQLDRDTSTLLAYYFGFYSALFNLFLQAALLAVSLLSLADKANLVPPWLAVTAGVGGLVLLAFGVLNTVIMTSFREGPIKEEGPGSV